MTQRIRSGFSLVELLLVVVLLGIVGGGLMRMVANQQRFYQGTYDLIDLRSQLRQAEAVLSTDLRGMSSPGGDLVTMTDSSMDFRYTMGSSISCTTPTAGGSTVIIPPTTTANGNMLTNWLSMPAQYDTAYVFDEGGNNTSSSDDVWQPYEIVSVTSGSNCNAAYNAQSAGYAVLMKTSISPTIVQGAPIRFVRRAHYSLYQSSNDNNWYLGYMCSSCGNTTVSPIAGPFLPYDANTGSGTSGIRITYFDSTGATTANTQNVSRINIVLRGQTRGALNVSGLKRGVYVDSIRMNVALRNRS